MTEKRFGCVGVTDGDGPARRHRDRRRPAAGDGSRPARTQGRRDHDPVRRRTIGPEALAAEALHAMNARGRPITALFVVDAARTAGRDIACP